MEHCDVEDLRVSGLAPEPRRRSAAMPRPLIGTGTLGMLRPPSDTTQLTRFHLIVEISSDQADHLGVKVSMKLIYFFFFRIFLSSWVLIWIEAELFRGLQGVVVGVFV